MKSNSAMRLLIIEDNVAVNTLITESLLREGYIVDSVFTGSAALDAIDKDPPHLILMDYRLPDMTGQDLVRVMDDKRIQIPFIVMTASDDVEIGISMMESGAIDFLIKDGRFYKVIIQKVKNLTLFLETQRHLDESKKQLDSSEKKYKRILDSMKDPVFICDSDYQILYENPGLKAYLGGSNLGEKCYSVIFHRENPCQHCREYQSPDEAFEMLNVKDPVKHKTLMVSSGPIEFRQGNIARLNIIRDISDLTEARNAAEKSEQKYRFLAENSVDAIWQMDRRLRFTYMSPSSEELLGYAPDEMSGHHLWEFTTRKEFFRMARYALLAMNGKYRNTPISFEGTMIHKSGHTVDVEITGRLLVSDSGKIRGVQGTTKNITERVRARQELDYHNHLLQTLIDHIPDQIYVKDRESRFLVNNAGHRKELGVAEDVEMFGKCDSDFFDAETSKEFYEDEQRIIQTGKPLINKEEYKTYRDGTHRWSLTTKIPLKNQRGEIIGIAGINRDITRRKDQEEELIRSRYELAFRNKISNIFLISDSEHIYNRLLEVILKEMNSKVGFIGFINKNGSLVCPAMTGGVYGHYTPGEPKIFEQQSWGGIWGDSLKTKKSLFLNSGLKLPMGHLELRNALSVPVLLGEKLIGQVTVADKLGGFKEIDVKLLESICNYIAPILDAKLKEDAMREERLKAFEDVKASKERAEESDRLKTAFLLNLSHELRTPLNSIIGFTNLLKGQYTDDQTLSRYSEMIDQASQDLIKMVDDTIDISKLESRKLDFNFSMENIVPWIKDLHRNYSKYFKQRYDGVTLSINVPDDGLMLKADHPKLKKAVSKVIDNAGKFSKSGGNVELSCHRNGQETIVIQVRDSGIGIPAEFHEAVFEKFRKIVDKEVLYRGNGLGLSIARGLVERMGGTVELESTPGMGTTVRFILHEDIVENPE